MKTAMVLLPSFLHIPADFFFFFEEFFLPFLNVTRLSADSHGAFSSSADQKRPLLPSSVPLTYWYSVTFEFHNCSTTSSMAHFKQRCHEALQHFLRCVSLNESHWCVDVCSDYNKFAFYFFFFHIYLTMTNSNLPPWKITSTRGIINLCWYWSHASRGVRLYFQLGGGI